MSNENIYTIKDLPFTERPREKLINYGVRSLSNVELLAVIIRTGYKDKSALELAKDIIYMDQSGIKNLSQITYEELISLKGVGSCKASQILASIELGKRINNWMGEEKIRVNTPQILATVLMDDMKFLNKEHFKIALLDTKNQVISIDNVSIGTLNASIVHPRDVFNIAIKKNANSIILIHNHPSGDTTPSKEDINVTNRLIDVGKIIGIKVLDHIIIGDNRYLSFKEESLM
ncbi:MAG TPA: DNA repair protein RadC [Tissierellaceae bacterium]